MLRITALSLFLGAVTLIGVLVLFFAPPSATGEQAPLITWSATTAEVHFGNGVIDQGDLQLKLTASGWGVVNLPTGEIEAAAYPFLHLAFEESSKTMRVLIDWYDHSKKRRAEPTALENTSRKSLWIATNELQGWDGKISSIGLTFMGRSGETIRIKDFSLSPPSTSHQLQALYADITGYVPWQRAAMNTYTGVTKVSSFYPVPLAVSLLFFSLLAYGLLLLVFRIKLRFNWTVVALIFLACWISLDLLWQNKLLLQLADTHRTFSGKTTAQKLAVGPDANLYPFISAVKQRLEPGDSRVFVSSADIYQGMRGAYYLYPFNVYWSLDRPELPGERFLRKGDYIVLIKPTTTRFDPVEKLLTAQGNEPLSAESVFSNWAGSLVRLN